MTASIATEHYLRRFHTLNGADVLLEAVYEVDLDNSYLTGGEDMDFTDGGEFASVLFVKTENISFTGYIPQYDLSTASIVMFEAGTASAPLDECDSGDDLSATTILCTVVGPAA